MRLYLASGNAHKVAELQALADAHGPLPAGGGAGARIEVVSAREVGGMPPVAEDTGQRPLDCCPWSG